METKPLGYLTKFEKNRSIRFREILIAISEESIGQN